MSNGDIGILIKGGLDEESAESIQSVLGSFERMLKACKSDTVQEGVVALLEKIAKSPTHCSLNNVSIVQGGYKPKESDRHEPVDDD